MLQIYPALRNAGLNLIRFPQIRAVPRYNYRPFTDSKANFVDPTRENKMVPIKFILANGDIKHVQARIGESLLETAHRNKIPLEGACDGNLACATCHVFLSPKLYKKVPEIGVLETELLCTAPMISETSRLACNVGVTEEFANQEIAIPKITRNFYVDDFIPEPH